MILSIPIGVDQATGKTIYLDPTTFRTHYHLVGATGAGKTTAIHALLRPIMKEPKEKACVFVIDPMGNLSRDILRWMVSRKCPEHVRRRLLYLEPARESVVLPFNPLTYCSEANMYYQVARAVDLILRAWTAQDLSEQPRLRQWSYKAMCAVSSMGFPISMSRYLLHPGTPEHVAMLERIPGEIRHHWCEILSARGNEATKILESTRNRFDPFFENPVLKRMFGATAGRFDCERMINERRIVIVNLARLGNLPTHEGSAIGSLIVNEIFETIYNMATMRGSKTVDPTYLLMDEFQKFVGPDIEDALPTVRQMGLRLILAHQSFSQLERGDIDLSNMIWQARSRMMFSNSADDADIIANELATLTFDRMAIKDRRTSLKQLIRGYRKEWLASEGVADSQSESTVSQRSVGYNRMSSTSHTFDFREPLQPIGTKKGSASTQGTTTGENRTSGATRSSSRSEANVPIHETIEEVSNVTYVSFDEHRLEWQRVIRELTTGMTFLKTVNDPSLRRVQVNYDPIRESSEAEAAVDELIEQNFEQDFFISAAEADRLADKDRLTLLTPEKIIVRTETKPPPDGTKDPFR